MKCPICYFEDTKVLDSRVASDGLSFRRRRECLKCGFRFSTYEELEILDVAVIKRDGRRESYSRDKLVIGLKKAAEAEGYSSPEEFALYVLEKSTVAAVESLSEEEVKNRLKGLGYIDG